MGPDTDSPVIRLLNGRRLLYWRIAAIFCFVFACIVSTKHFSSRSTIASTKPHIARLVIRGVIKNDVSRVTDALAKAQKSPSVTGLLLVVDSPGGGVTGGERLHDAVANFAAVKPVVVSMGDMGASAAYMLSVPAQHLVARPSTLTGSIGVIMQRADVSGLLSRWGVAMDAITSGKMKDQTDPTSALTPEGRAMLQGLVDDLFGQFVQMVANGRHMPVEKVRELADGRAYTGHQAIALNLVDELGDENVARRWLDNRLHVSSDYPVAALLPAHDQHWYENLFGRRRSAMLEWMIGTQAEFFLKERAASLWLDGPVAILQL